MFFTFFAEPASTLVVVMMDDSSSNSHTTTAVLPVPDQEQEPTNTSDKESAVEVTYKPIFVDAGSSKKSGVWKHFGYYKMSADGIVLKDYTWCDICKELVKYNTGNTTNMRNHLLRKHNIDITKIPVKRFIPSEAEDGPSTSKQPRITSLAKIKEGSTVYKTISDSLLRYISMDFAPLSTVESVWFKDYTKNLNPRYDLPTRKN